ncbi:MAG: DUF6364 family protein [Spirochaetales bacterium]
MNITLSADRELVEKAREYAAAHGTSVNQLVRDYLERLVGEISADEAASAFASFAREHAGTSSGARITREDIYAERMRSVTGE